MIFCDYVEDANDVPRHSHHCYEIDFFVEAKGVTHIVDNCEIPIRVGSIVTSCERDFHQYDVDKSIGGSYRAYSVQFSNFFLDEIGEEKFRLIISKQFESLVSDEFDRFEKLFSLLYYEVSRDPEDVEGISRLLLQTIISSTLRLTTSFGMPFKNSRIYANELTYVNRHFKESITLNDVAEHVGYSPVYLSKIFKSRHGVSFKKYLLHKRLGFARSLLLSTSQTITEISVQAGFTNLTHFSKAIKDYYGVSPSDFRDNMSNPSSKSVKE
jgi:AraC-like DNA-binding protein